MKRFVDIKEIKRLLGKAYNRTRLGYIVEDYLDLSTLIAFIFILVGFILSIIYGRYSSEYFIVVISSLTVIILNNIIRNFIDDKNYENEENEKYIKKSIKVKKIKNIDDIHSIELIDESLVEDNDYILFQTDDVITNNGIIVKGTALIDESCMTGESAPVLKEADGTINYVKRGTRVISDYIVVKAEKIHEDNEVDYSISEMKYKGYMFAHKKDPILFIIVVRAISVYIVFANKKTNLTISTISEMMVYIPAIYILIIPLQIVRTTDFMLKFKKLVLRKYHVYIKNFNSLKNIFKTDIIIFDKTGTITFRDREAVEAIPASGVSNEEFIDASILASYSDYTPEGRSIVAYLKRSMAFQGRYSYREGIKFIPFSSETGLSGCDEDNKKIRKGSRKAISEFVKEYDGIYPKDCVIESLRIEKEGGTAISVAEDGKVLGVIHLKEILKDGIKESISNLYSEGYNITLITGDKYLTTASLARESGIENFVAEADADKKYNYIRECIEQGQVVTAIGDGDNDIYAFKYADISIAMGNATDKVKKYADIIDYDSEPAKIVDIIKVSKEVNRASEFIKISTIVTNIIKYLSIIYLMVSISTGKNIVSDIVISMIFLNAVVYLMQGFISVAHLKK